MNTATPLDCMRPQPGHPPVGPRAAQALERALMSVLVAALAACGSAPLQSLPEEAPAPVVEVTPAPVVEAPAPPPTEAPALPPPAPVHPRAANPRPPADAVPRAEPLVTSANQPYVVKGESYVPMTQDLHHMEEGLASWYGHPFHGRRTATGERYDMHAMTAAHKTLPLPSYAVVRNKVNGREIVVRINDRGPFVGGRIIDLSYAAARRLGIHGVGRVAIRRLTNAEIRSGAWKSMGGALALADAQPH